MLASELAAARDEIWAESPGGPERLDEARRAMSLDVFSLWFWVDRSLPDGRLLVDRVLPEDPPATAAERRYLELLRGTCMRLYQVVDQRPGASLTLRDLIDDTEVTVRERTASREMQRVPSGRTLLHRFIVRGHERRPAPAWKVQRMRCIESYWKAPDLAAVIERTYKLTP